MKAFLLLFFLYFLHPVLFFSRSFFDSPTFSTSAICEYRRHSYVILFLRGLIRRALFIFTVPKMVGLREKCNSYTKNIHEKLKVKCCSQHQLVCKRYSVGENVKLWKYLSFAGFTATFARQKLTKSSNDHVLPLVWTGEGRQMVETHVAKYLRIYFSDKVRAGVLLYSYVQNFGLSRVVFQLLPNYYFWLKF